MDFPLVSVCSSGGGSSKLWLGRGLMSQLNLGYKEETRKGIACILPGMYCECLNVMCSWKGSVWCWWDCVSSNCSSCPGTCLLFRCFRCCRLKKLGVCRFKIRKVYKLISVRLLGFSKYVQLCLPRRSPEYFVKPFFLFELVHGEEEFSFD